MKPVTAVCLAIAVALLIVTIPANAITGNFVEDNIHTYVGLAAFYDESGAFLWRCSGALLSPTIFLTAGHCTTGATSARIWFHQDVGSQYNTVTGAPDPRTGYPTTCISGDPLCVTSSQLYNFNFQGLTIPATNDVGLIVLPQPITFTTQFAVLAAPGSLDYLASNTRRGAPPTVTFTGYGVSDERPAVVSFRERLMATGFIINVRNTFTGGYNVQVSTNVGQGRGGTCFGDSGGPILWDNSNIVIAVNSFVINGNCAGTGFGFRVDTQAVYNWITSVTGVNLPTSPLT